MRRTLLRLFAPVVPSILCAVFLAAELVTGAAQPAHPQGFALPGGLSVGGMGRMARMRRDDGRRSFPGPRGPGGGIFKGRILTDDDEDEDGRRRRKGRRGDGGDRYEPKSGDFD